MFKPGQTEAWTEAFLRNQPRFLPATLADRLFASQILPEAILKPPPYPPSLAQPPVVFLVVPAPRGDSVLRVKRHMATISCNQSRERQRRCVVTR